MAGNRSILTIRKMLSHSKWDCKSYNVFIKHSRIIVKTLFAVMVKRRTEGLKTKNTGLP